MIVACWSGPRNISTALMRAWSSRTDTFVTDEPFYAHFLEFSQKKHPMREKIIKHYLSDYNEVIEYLTCDIPEQKTIWYQKHMAHHINDFSKVDWIKKCKNCILIRHPKEVINSYAAKNNLKGVEELGYPQQFEIIKFLKKTNQSYKIIDSEDLLKNPKNVLLDWCESINIDFDKSMLHWEKGNHKYDGIWWRHWYDNVIDTTGFQKKKEKDITIENKFDSIYNEAMKYYNYFKDIK